MVDERSSVPFAGHNFQVLSTPCHTAGHVSYWLGKTNPPMLFCGDTLFVGGCGRFFEGTPSQMVASLQKLSSLPPETLVCCGHEYTLSNMRFAAQVDPNNPAVLNKLAWAEEQTSQGLSTVPSTLGEELEYNPFMRLGEKSIRSSLGFTSSCTDTKVMQRLREMKNAM